MTNFRNSLRVAFLQARHMKETVKSFCKGLFNIRMKYRTCDTKLPKNVLLYLFQQVVSLVDILLNFISVSSFTWLLPEGRRYMASTLVRAIHEEKAVSGVVAMNFICKMEQLLSPFIDIISIVSHFHYCIPLQFSVCLKEDTHSRNLLEKMLQEMPTLWLVLTKRIYGERDITVTCDETHLNFPSECAILSQFLLQLREHFNLGFSKVECNIPKHPTRTKKFGVESLPHSFALKKKLLHDMLHSSFRVPAMVKACSNMSQKPCITLSNAHFELKIWVDLGIAYWWKAFRGNGVPTLSSLMVDPMQDMDLVNMAAQSPGLGGINITILYTPLENVTTEFRKSTY